LQRRETLQNRKVKPTKLTAPVHCSQNSKVPPSPSSSTSSASSDFLTLLETRIKNNLEQTSGHFPSYETNTGNSENSPQKQNQIPQEELGQLKQQEK
jgi:hypothetical protein